MQLSYLSAEEMRRLLSIDQPCEQRAALMADAFRINTLYSIMRAGSGHIGSSFSAMDVVTRLHLEELQDKQGHPTPIYFSSKGHDAPGLYAVLTGLGKLPFELLHGLRRMGGLPGHPDVGTPGIPCNTGSLGMGIAKAKGMIMAARLDGYRQPVYVLTGDGELQEGQNWESLQGATNRSMGELTVIVDHNKIQSDTWVEDVSPLGDLEAKFRSFGWEVARCDGHDHALLTRVLSHFATISDRPKILIADTIKGKGVSFMEKTSAAGEFEFYKFHSGAPSEEHFGAAEREIAERINSALDRLGQSLLKLERVELPDRTAPQGQRLVGAYSRALMEQAAAHPEIVVLDADLMLDTGLIPFAEAHPTRFIECGIAEQDMVSMAGGLALRGRLPIVHSFSCFLSTRPNEQIYNNATEKSRIIYAMSLAGLLPAGPGHSHQSVRDISAMAAIPGLDLIEPCCEEEVATALDYAVSQAPGSTALRLTSIPVAIPYPSPARSSFVRGRGASLRDGKRVLLIGYGPVLLSEAWKASEQLEKETGDKVGLINLPWLNQIDPAWLTSCLEGVGLAVFLDNHYRIGGQGQMLLACLAQQGIRVPCLHLAIDEIPLCGTNAEVLEAHRLDAASIASAVREKIG